MNHNHKKYKKNLKIYLKKKKKKKQSIYILFEDIKEKTIRRYDEFYFMNQPVVFE